MNKMSKWVILKNIYEKGNLKIYYILYIYEHLRKY